MIQNTPLYWSHIALETASNLGFAKIVRYQGLSESQDFLNLLLAFRTMCPGSDGPDLGSKLQDREPTLLQVYV